MKKPGYYLSEEKRYIARLRKELQLAPLQSLSINVIMEAA